MAQNAVVLQILLDDRNSAKVIADLKKRFNAVEASADKATAATGKGLQKASKEGKNLTKVTGNANQVMFAFGDAVNDAAFAGGNLANVARFAGNNITFAAESFSNIVARTGSFKSALGALLTSLKGPGGFLLGLNIAITAINLFGDAMFSSGQQAKMAKKEIEELTKAAEDLQQVLSSDTGFADQIQRDIERNQQAIDLAERRAELQSQINILESSQPALSEEERKRLPILREQVESLNQLITTLGFENNELEELQENLKSLQRQQELYNGVIGTSETKLAAFIDGLRGDAKIAIENYESGLAGSTSELQRQQEHVENLFRSFQILANQGVDGAAGAARVLVSIWRDLNNVLDDTQQKAPVVMQSLGFLDKEGTGETTVPGPNVQLPSATQGGIQAVRGSIADLQMRLRSFRNFREMIDPNTEAFEELTKAIEETEKALEDARGTGDKSMTDLERATDLLGQSLAQAVIHGKNLEDVLANLAKQLASRALINGLTMLLTGGSFSIGKLFGFQHGTDAGFPGMGIAGERGPELVVAPPFSSVITNENIERLTRLRQQARLGAENISSVSTSGMQQAVRDAVIEGMARVRLSPVVRVSDIEQGLDERQEVKVLIGNG